MTGSEPQDFMLPKEVQATVRLSAPTIWRLQKAGKFPAYFKLSPKKNALHRSALQAWKADPEGWARRNDEARQEVSNG